MIKATASIVIPTRNAGDDLHRLLKKLRSQELDFDLEILVVDSGSTDDTINHAKQFQAKIISIPPHEFNHGRTRNLGIEATSRPFIFFFTQDALPTSNHYISTLLRSIQEKQAAGGHARQIPRPNASPIVRRDRARWINSSPEKRVTQILSMNQFFARSPLQCYYDCCFENVASVIRREVWEKIPFPEVRFGEDIEWAYRVLCNGYSLLYEPDAIVEHSHERSSNYLFKRIYIDHYHLYQLFGIRTVPSRKKAWTGFVKQMLQDGLYLIRNRKLDPVWLSHFLQIPFYSWASVWGQYAGAKAAARGDDPQASRDV